jgi:hypothetical protein
MHKTFFYALVFFAKNSPCSRPAAGAFFAKITKQ